MPSPPTSPPLAAQSNERERAVPSRQRAKAGAAHTITEECERLFGDDLARVFLGERRRVSGGLVIGAQNNNLINMSAGAPFVGVKRDHRASTDSGYATLDGRRLSNSTVASGSTASSAASRFSLADLRLPEWAGAPSSSVSSVSTLPDSILDHLALRAAYAGAVQQWLEVWDYIGSARFRGFTAMDPAGETKSLFVFFDADCVGRELKQGLMALLELASTPALDCSNLVVALDRSASSPPEARSLVRDLGWCGFEAVTLEQWTGDGAPLTSRRWFFMGVDV